MKLDSEQYYAYTLDDPAYAHDKWEDGGKAPDWSTARDDVAQDRDVAPSGKLDN